MGKTSDSALYRRLQKDSKRFDRDPTDNTAWILLSSDLWRRDQSALR